VKAMNANSSRGAKRVISNILLVLALPVLFFGLIDPLEGGLALLLAVLIYALAFSLRKEKPAKLLWIPVASAFLIGTVVLAMAIFVAAAGPGNPLHIVLVAGNWVYRAAVIVALVGGVITAVNAFRPAGGNSGSR
jgi:hypothetical protein